ncbi:hypothetical protein KAJ27_25000 [bacterium]|nr:hypothetical protein [bacterium]
MLHKNFRFCIILFILISSGVFTLYSQNFEEKVKGYESNIIEKEEKFIGGSMVVKKKTFKSLFPGFIKNYTSKLDGKTGTEKEKYCRKIFFLQQGLTSIYKYTTKHDGVLKKHLEKILKDEFYLNCHIEFLRNILTTMFFEIKSENIYNLPLLEIMPLIAKLSVFYDSYADGLPFYYSYLPDYNELKKRSINGYLPDVTEEIQENLSMKHKLFLKKFPAAIEKRFNGILENVDIEESVLEKGEKFYNQSLDSIKNSLGIKLEKAGTLDGKLKKNTIELENFMDEIVFLEKDEKIVKWIELMKENLAARVQLLNYKKVILDFLPESYSDQINKLLSLESGSDIFEIELKTSGKKVNSLENISVLMTEVSSLEEFSKDKIRGIKQNINNNIIVFKKTLNIILKKYKAQDYRSIQALYQLESNYWKFLTFQSIFNNLINSMLFNDSPVNKKQLKRYSKFISKITGKLQKTVSWLAEKTGVSVSDDQSGELDRQKLKMLALLGDGQTKSVVDKDINKVKISDKPLKNDSSNNVLDALSSWTSSDDKVNSDPKNTVDTKTVDTVIDKPKTDSNKTSEDNSILDTLVDMTSGDKVAADDSNDQTKKTDISKPDVNNDSSGDSVLDALADWKNDKTDKKVNTDTNDSVSDDKNVDSSGNDKSDNILDSLSNWISEDDKKSNDTKPVVVKPVKIKVVEPDKSDDGDKSGDDGNILDALSDFVSNNKNDDSVITDTTDAVPTVRTSSNDDDKEFTRYISQKENFSFDYPSEKWLESQKLFKYEVTLRHKGSILPAISVKSEMTKNKMSLKNFVENRKKVLKKAFSGMNYKLVDTENNRDVYYIIIYNMDFFGIKCSNFEYVKGDGNNFFVINSIVTNEQIDDVEYDLESIFKSFRILKLLKPVAPVVKKKIVKKPKKKKSVKVVKKTPVKKPVYNPPAKKLSLKEKMAKLRAKMKARQNNSSASSTTYKPTATVNKGNNLNNYEKYWYSKINQFGRDIAYWEKTTFVQKRRIRVSKRIQFKVKALFRDIRVEEGKVEKYIKQFGDGGHIKDVRNNLVRLHFKAAKLKDWAN